MSGLLFPKARHAQRYLRDSVLPYGGDDCLTWPYAKDGDGYAKVRNGGPARLVHRLVCEIVHGVAPSPKHEAAHSCGKGRDGCVNPRHLSWKTTKQNQEDRVEHGTSNRGTRNGSAKLTADDVRTIRAMKGRASCPSLARQFHVSTSHVARIHAGAAWGWLA
jgi:hypothetical protein